MPIPEVRRLQVELGDLAREIREVKSLTQRRLGSPCCAPGARSSNLQYVRLAADLSPGGTVQVHTGKISSEGCFCQRGTGTLKDAFCMVAACAGTIILATKHGCNWVPAYPLNHSLCAVTENILAGATGNATVNLGNCILNIQVVNQTGGDIGVGSRVPVTLVRFPPTIDTCDPWTCAWHTCCCAIEPVMALCDDNQMCDASVDGAHIMPQRMIEWHTGGNIALWQTIRRETTFSTLDVAQGGSVSVTSTYTAEGARTIQFGTTCTPYTANDFNNFSTIVQANGPWTHNAGASDALVSGFAFNVGGTYTRTDVFDYNAAAGSASAFNNLGLIGIDFSNGHVSKQSSANWRAGSICQSFNPPCTTVTLTYNTGPDAGQTIVFSADAGGYFRDSTVAVPFLDNGAELGFARLNAFFGTCSSLVDGLSGGTVGTINGLHVVSRDPTSCDYNITGEEHTATLHGNSLSATTTYISTAPNVTLPFVGTDNFGSQFTLTCP